MLKKIIVKVMIIILLLISWANARSIPLGFESLNELAFDRIFFQEKDKCIEITEVLLGKEEEIPVIQWIIPEEAKQYAKESGELSNKIAQELSNIDLNLSYYLNKKGEDHEFNEIETDLGQINLYAELNTAQKPIAFIKLPAVLVVIKRSGDFLKIKVSGKKAAWASMREINSDKLAKKLLADIDKVSRQLEANQNIKRFYYKEKLEDRLGWGSLGILGSTVLLIDGLSKSGLDPFAASSAAGVARGSAYILGALEVVVGGYLLYQSIDHLMNPAEKFVYSKTEPKTEYLKLPDFSEESIVIKAEVVSANVNTQNLEQAESVSQDIPVEGDIQ